MADATSLLLGLEGLEVTGVVTQVDRVRVVDVVTTDPEASRCPDCCVVSRSVKDRTVTRPRDIRYGDDPILLRWNKTRYRCVNQECARVTFTESISQVPPRRRTTTRLRTQIGRSVGEAARSVSEVATGVGVSWPTAHAAFVEHAEQVLIDPQPVRVLGIDETRRGRPRWIKDADGRRWVRVDPWDTGFVDLGGDQGLLGQVEGRTSAAVTDWLTTQSEQFRTEITHVVIDPSAAYAAAVTDTVLPNAQVVVDHFHLIKLCQRHRHCGATSGDLRRSRSPRAQT